MLGLLLLAAVQPVSSIGLPPLTVLNGSFEFPVLPNDGADFGAPTNWSHQAVSAAGWVDNGWNFGAINITNLDGNQAAWMNTEVGNALYQQLADTYTVGHSYELTAGFVKASSAWSGSTDGNEVQLQLYYGAFNVIAFATATANELNDSQGALTYIFASLATVEATDAWAGEAIGIRIISTAEGPGNPVNDWAYDNVLLESATDDDGVPDAIDNCIDVFNPDQRDTDNDLIGNLCDPDIALPNDCFVNFADLNAMKDAFFSGPASPGWNADADLNGDDGVNFGDLNIMKDMFFRPPGPSGPAPGCAPHNFAATGMQVVGDPGRITIGHPAQLEIGISSDRPAGSVTADILIINKDAYDVDAQNPPDPHDPAHNDAFRIRIGQVTIPQVMEGTHTYPASVLVPYSKSEVSEVIVSNLDIPSTYVPSDADFGVCVDRQDFRTGAAPVELTSVTVRIDPGPTTPVLTVAGHALQSPFIPPDHPPGDYTFTADNPIPLLADTLYFFLLTLDPVGFTRPVWSTTNDATLATGTGLTAGSYTNESCNFLFCDCSGNPAVAHPTFAFQVAATCDGCDPEQTAPIWDPIAAGEYYLYAQIDPEDSFVESDEDDNVPMDGMGDFTVGAGAEIVDAIGGVWNPNIYVENLGIDLGNLGFDPGMLATSLVQLLDPEPAAGDFCTDYPVHQDNNQPSYVGLNARINSSGAYWPNGGDPGDRPQPIPRVDISGGATIVDTVYPIKFWDTATASYAQTQSIYDLKPGAARDVHLGVMLEPSQLIGVVEDLFGSFTIIPPTVNPGPCGIWPEFPLLPSTQTIEAIYACIEEHLASTRLNIDITAWDVADAPVGEFDPPGFPYTNDWAPDPSDPATWLVGAPVTISIIVPPDDVVAIVLGLVGLTPPTPPAVQAYDYSWEKSMGGEYASAGVSFYAGMGIDGEASPGDPAGAFATVDGRVPVSLFGFELDIFRAYFEARGLNTASGQTYSDHNYFEYGVETPNGFFEPATQLALSVPAPSCGATVPILDQTIGEPDPLECSLTHCPLSPGVNDDQRCNHCVDLNDPMCNVSECNACRRDHCLSFALSNAVQQIFVIGVVPLTVEFTSGATVGLQATADFPACSDDPDSGPSELEMRAGPFAAVSASLSAYIDLVLASAGATAEIELISDAFEAYARVEDLSHTVDEIGGRLRIGLENTLTGPNGEGYLWAQYPCATTCRVCIPFAGCVGIPCPGTCRETLPLFEFETFERVDPLYCKASPGTVYVTRQ